MMDDVKRAQASRDRIYFGGNRQLVLDRSNGKCVRCGAKAQLVHHMDRDGSLTVWDRFLDKVVECDPNRLEALCRTCHAKEHHAEMQANVKRKNGRWALYHDKCIQCGTTERRYAAKGLCMRCYDKNRR